MINFWRTPRKKDKYFKSSEYPLATFPLVIAFFLAQQLPSIKLNEEETSTKALSKPTTQPAYFITAEMGRTRQGIFTRTPET